MEAKSHLLRIVLEIVQNWSAKVDHVASDH